MRSQSDSFAILDAALNAANADEADALFVSTDQNITRFANSNVHQNMSEVSAELTLRVMVDNAVGVAATTVFDADEIARTAALAREAARHGDPLQNFTGLCRDSDPFPNVHTFHDRVASIPPAEKARALRTMFDRGRENGLTFAGAYATGAPCATRIVCIGSPLPQFGRPQICQLARSPTASHERQNSGVVPP